MATPAEENIVFFKCFDFKVGICDIPNPPVDTGDSPNSPVKVGYSDIANKAAIIDNSDSSINEAVIGDDEPFSSRINCNHNHNH